MLWVSYSLHRKYPTGYKGRATSNWEVQAYDKMVKFVSIYVNEMAKPSQLSWNKLNISIHDIWLILNFLLFLFQRRLRYTQLSDRYSHLPAGDQNFDLILLLDIHVLRYEYLINHKTIFFSMVLVLSVLERLTFDFPKNNIFLQLQAPDRIFCLHLALREKRSKHTLVTHSTPCYIHFHISIPV